MRLLTANNTKTAKGEKQGWKTLILYLSPHTLSGRNFCPHSTSSCRSLCLFSAGRGLQGNVVDARYRRSRLFIEDRDAFLAQLDLEIGRGLKSAHKAGMRLAVRLNGTSDLPWEKFFRHNMKNWSRQGVRFYDYTKNPYRARACRSMNCWGFRWYDLTFSRSEETSNNYIRGMLSVGVRVTVIFDKVPERWGRYKVIDGDQSDLRFLEPKGRIIGLKYKPAFDFKTRKRITLAEAVKSGFVIEAKV